MKKVVYLLWVIILALPVFGQQKDLPYVILISFDGFSSDYIHRFDLPNFSAFIKGGVASEGLIPSFPSKTFPNHYTVVTGLYPGHHGLVDNQFYDPYSKQHYSMRIREAVTDSIYYGGMPLWRLAKKHGVKSASYFWVGSEIKEDGLHPDYYYDYDQSVPSGHRVNQVMDWLALPEKDRPHFITLYFSSPDWESHRNGPYAENTKQKVIEMDSLLGDFMKRIRGTQLPVNVIIVSDHGMSELVDKPETYIFLDEIVKTKEGSITVVNGGTQAHIYTTSQKVRDSLHATLKSKAVDFSVIKREDFPKHWHYNHDRSGNLMILANPAKYIITGDREKNLKSIKHGATFGAHGYDPDKVRDMYGIFYANGPNIKPGISIKAFRNIHVYPFIAKILNLEIPEVDGKLEVLKPIYRR